MEIRMLMEDLVNEQVIDEYDEDNPFDYKFVTRTALEYSQYLQYEVDRLNYCTDMMDFLEEEYENLLVERRESRSVDQLNETKIKMLICEKVFTFFEY